MSFLYKCKFYLSHDQNYLHRMTCLFCINVSFGLRFRILKMLTMNTVDKMLSYKLNLWIKCRSKGCNFICLSPKNYFWIKYVPRGCNFICEYDRYNLSYIYVKVKNKKNTCCYERQTYIATNINYTWWSPCQSVEYHSI
jgi:hypothetical protein